jgi:hypothetical protein
MFINMDLITSKPTFNLSFSNYVCLLINVLAVAWFHASAASYMRSMLFWIIRSIGTAVRDYQTALLKTPKEHKYVIRRNWFWLYSKTVCFGRLFFFLHATDFFVTHIVHVSAISIIFQQLNFMIHQPICSTCTVVRNLIKTSRYWYQELTATGATYN